jgi:hypothetical protein
MNKLPIEQAQDADLRLSPAALLRAALRARELAMKTGTAIVVSRDGKLEYLTPEASPAETPGNVLRLPLPFVAEGRCRYVMVKDKLWDGIEPLLQ